MRIARAKVILAAAVLALVIGRAAGAQELRDHLGAGLSFLEADGTRTGFTLDYAHTLVPFTKGPLSVVGDFGLNAGEGVTVTSYLGGLRFRWDVARKFSPFGQFLLGAQHCCADTSMALQPGFGLEIVVNSRLRVRAQVDFRDVWLEGTDSSDQRYTFGISLPMPGGR